MKTATLKNKDSCHVIHGFTLIELLVVISIISILIAMLLPALKAARGTARSAQCLSRQRQVALAVFMYRNDFRDWYPVDNIWGTGIVSDDHIQDIGPYIDPGDYRYNLQNNMFNGKNGADKNFLLDPANPYAGGNVGSLVSIAWGWRVYNYQLTAKFGLGSMAPGRIHMIRNAPSSVIMIGAVHGGNGNYWGEFQRTSYMGPRYNLFLHPGETTNIAFADGHAKNVGNDAEFKRQVFETKVFGFNIQSK